MRGIAVELFEPEICVRFDQLDGTAFCHLFQCFNQAQVDVGIGHINEPIVDLHTKTRSAHALYQSFREDGLQCFAVLRAASASAISGTAIHISTGTSPISHKAGIRSE